MKILTFIFAFASLCFIVDQVVGTTQFGRCKCDCINPKCDFPKTAEDCGACAAAVNAVKHSFDNGKCWIKAGDMSAIDCGLRCYRSLAGCSGFLGVSHYTYGNMCWCTYKNP